MGRELRIGLIGGNLESLSVLERLLGDRFRDAIAFCVVPDHRLASRTSDLAPVAQLASSAGIPVVRTGQINSPETLAELSTYRPSHLFVSGWSQIFRSALLDLPSEFVVGSHPSPLPLGRGRAPVPWTLIEGAERSAVSLFKMDGGVDSGPILRQEPFFIEPGWHASELYAEVSSRLADAFSWLAGALEEGPVPEREQDECRATYRAARRPEDGLIDLSLEADGVARLVRAVSEPYPGSFCYYGASTLKIWAAPMIPVPAYRGVIGQTLLATKGAALVQTGSSPIWLGGLELDGEPILGTDLDPRVRLRPRAD